MNGTGFVNGSQILWNGTTQTTSFISDTTLSAQISAPSVAAPGAATVTVSSPAPGGGSSNAASFSIVTTTSNLIVVNVEGNDLAWVAQQKKLYVSVPASASSMGSTITAVDPIAGMISGSTPLTSEAGRISATDDGQFLYAILSNENAVARYSLPAVSSDIKWTLGSDPISGTIYPWDVKPQPGAAHTVAVLTAVTPLPPPGFANGIAIYDDATRRATQLENYAGYLSSVEWKLDGSEVFIEDNASSDRALYTASVNSGGVTLSQTFGAAFRAWGVHLHSDPQTGYLYSDQGEIVNSANGLPVGNYPIERASGYTSLAAIDAGLKRVFVLSRQQQPTPSTSFVIRVFDQMKLNLVGEMLLPGIVGTPTNLVRWGTSGLAFVTKSEASSSGGGNLYILDGAFVNPAGPADTAAGNPVNPMPILDGISATTAIVGSGGVTITLTGRDFVSQPVVQWNGATIPSTWVNNTELQTTVPASNLATAGLGSLTVVNAEPGGGVSDPLPFAVNPASPAGTTIDVYSAGGNDVTWDSQRQKLYVSAAGIQGALGNRISTIDPIAKAVSMSDFVGSDSAKLSLSSGAQYLYVGMNGQNSVQRLNLPSLSADISYALGSDSFDGPFFAVGLKADPSAPGTAAVSTGEFDVSPNSTGITIFDNATARPTRAPGWNSSAYAFASLEWGSDDTTMYSAAEYTPTDLYVLTANSNGIQVTTKYQGVLQYTLENAELGDFGGLHFDNGTGLLYTDGGQVVKPADGTVAGTFGASGLVATDSSLNRVFILGQTTAQAGSANFTIESFNQNTFAAVDSITISNVVGTPTAFVRWGSNGLAIVTRVGGIADSFNIGPGQLYVISGTFVNSAAPASAARRAPLTNHVRKTWNSLQRNPQHHSRRSGSFTR